MKSEAGRTVGEYPKKVTIKGRIYFFLLKNIFCRLACWLWVSKTKGLENIPRKEPFLVVSNHQSYIDFMFVTFVFRKIRFLSGFIKDAYYDVSCLNYFLRDLAQIRVDRERKIESINSAVEILKEGHVVVLFPEGTRTKTGKIGKARRGLSLIGKELTNVSVIPVRISGANKIWPHYLPTPNFLAGRKVRVFVGKPVKCSDYEGNGEVFSQKVMGKVAELTRCN